LIINDDEANDFRKKFESNLHINYKPVILILIQGGYNSLEDILNAIERQIPILLFSVNSFSMFLNDYLSFNFFKDTGGCAGLLGEIYNKIKDLETNLWYIFNSKADVCQFQHLIVNFLGFK
jgi:hypothetical protein